MNQNKAKPDLSKNRSRGWSDDMSTDAIKRRLEIVAELYQLWLGLKKAKPVGKPLPVDSSSGQVLKVSNFAPENYRLD